MTREDKAYQFYLQRSSQHGHDIEDWLSAEKQVEAEFKEESASSSRGQSPRKKQGTFFRRGKKNGKRIKRSAN